MSDFISRLFSGSLSNPAGAAPPSHTLCLRPSPKDSHQTDIYPIGHPEGAPPLYSVIASQYKKPNITFYRGGPNPHNKIGDAQFPLLSSTTKLSLRGQPVRLKMSQLSGNFSIECPPMGKLKWHVSQMTGSSMELRDESGFALAQLKSAGWLGSSEKRLLILVPCDDFFVELVVLSGMAAKALTKAEMEGAAEVVGAIAGA